MRTAEAYLSHVAHLTVVPPILYTFGTFYGIPPIVL